MAKNNPSTGDGHTSGRKPARYNVTVQSAEGTVNWKQTSGLFGGKPKKAAPQSSSAPTRKSESHSWFGTIFLK